MRPIFALTLLALVIPALAAAQPKGPPRPTVTDAQATMQQPIVADQPVVKVQIKPGNTTDRIPAANPTVAISYFAIDSQGNITVTSTGASAMNAQTANVTYTLTVTATNQGGTGTGTVTVLVKVVVQPPVISSGQSFTTQTPVTAGQVIGKVQATNSPTSWAITGATP